MHDEPGDRGSAGLRQLAIDVLSGLIFLALFLITNNIFLATAAALATGIGQVIWMIWRRQKTDAMQWLVMALVIALGVTTLVTHNPVFVVLKPSILEAGIAAVMLWPRWIARYMPARARDALPPGLILFWGYLHAAAWFAVAVSNLVVARAYGLRAWAVYSGVAPLVTIGVLTGLGLLVFPWVLRRAARERAVALSSPPVS